MYRLNNILNLSASISQLVCKTPSPIRVFQRTVFGLSKSDTKHEDIDLRTYAKYILKEGTNEEKRELMGCFRSKLRFAKGVVTIESN